ncbi:MAG: sugar ABC transporter permease, partial [Micrococcales bacterium]|nr:sugar ABC transporter permease [Micrococcales bacterium]
MKVLRQVFGANMRQYGMFFALIVLLLVFQFWTHGIMLTSTNLQNIINGYSYVLVMSFGMLFVIIMGQIDLAPGSVAAVVGICVALSIQNWHFPWWAGVLFGLVVGIAIGMWQGAWLAFIGVPGFVTTLAGQVLFRGMDQYIGKAASVPVPEQIQFIGNGYLPEFGKRWVFNINNSTLLLGLVAIVAVVFLELRRRGKVVRAGGTPAPIWAMTARLVVMALALAVLTAGFGRGRANTSFPMTGIILIVLILLYQFVATRTTIGRGVYAVGGNKAAAALTGISVRKTYFVAMTNMSFLAAVAAIMYVGRSTSTGPS